MGDVFIVGSFFFLEDFMVSSTLSKCHLAFDSPHPHHHSGPTHVVFRLVFSQYHNGFFHIACGSAFSS